MDNLEHPFNNAGVAPFTFVGVTERLYYPCKHLDGTVDTSVPPVPGGTCAHCGTGIREAFLICDATGKVFDVGSSCISKLKVEPKVITAALVAKRKNDKKKRENKIQRDLQSLTPAYEAVREELKNFPHPNKWLAEKGKTLFDYYDFVMVSASDSSKVSHMKTAITKAQKKVTCSDIGAI